MFTFEAAMAKWDVENAIVGLRNHDSFRLHLYRRALYAAWWLLENVDADDAARSDVFFAARGIANEATAS